MRNLQKLVLLRCSGLIGSVEVLRADGAARVDGQADGTAEVASGWFLRADGAARVDGQADGTAEFGSATLSLIAVG